MLYPPNTLTQVDAVRLRSIITQVYAWMTAGLLLTGVMATYTVNTPAISDIVLGNLAVFYGLLFGELALVWILSATIHRMSAPVATGMFMFYALLNGLTLSVIFMVYTASSIASTFFITAGTFGAMSLYGYMTKRDLTSIGNLCFMGLIGIIIASIVNIFLGNSMLYWAITYLGIAIFVGLTAWDTQKIKNMAAQQGDETHAHRVAIAGALTLYLDFINLFLLLLRVFGRRR